MKQSKYCHCKTVYFTIYVAQLGNTYDWCFLAKHFLSIPNPTTSTYIQGKLKLELDQLQFIYVVQRKHKNKSYIVAPSSLD